MARTIATTAVRSRPVETRPPRRRPIIGGNCPTEASCSHSPEAGYRPPLVAPDGGEQRGHAHQPVAGRAERRLGRLGDGGASGIDDLLDRERAEDAECDGHVDHGRDAERQVHRTGQFMGRVGEVLGRETDDAEAQEREERERNARHDVPHRGIAGEGQQAWVHVDQGHDRERRRNEPSPWPPSGLVRRVRSPSASEDDNGADHEVQPET